MSRVISFLPEDDLLKPSEAAAYFSVPTRAIILG
jgi:hypothetical protein